MTEADTCRKFVVPLLQKAGWDNDPHSIAEQRYFTAGRIVSYGPTARRRPGKRADYLPRYTRDLPLAVVEAKAAYKHAADGLQQAKDYATTLGLPFAYSTKGGCPKVPTTRSRRRALPPPPRDIGPRPHGPPLKKHRKKNYAQPHANRELAAPPITPSTGFDRRVRPNDLRAGTGVPCAPVAPHFRRG
jgi:type I site-specific restriction endonuclease